MQDALPHLSLLAVGLSGRETQVEANGSLPRAVLTASHLLLPESLGASAEAGDAQRLWRASVAHAVAHRLYSTPARPVHTLKPMGIAVVSAIEDVRVEQMLQRKFPGLRRWFVDSQPPSPAPDDLSFAALLTRMDRALLDSRIQDDNHWVNKARRLFDEAVASFGLDDYDAFRAIASILANDLGQMRVRFDPQGHVVAATYRDDNTYLWDFGEAQASPDGEISLQTGARRMNDQDDTEVRKIAEAVEVELGRFSYPEWDPRLERLRPDWCTVIEKRPAFAGDETPRKTESAVRNQNPLVLPRARRLNRARRLRRQWEGDEIDLNAAIEVLVDRRLRLQPEPRMFMRAGTALGDSSVLVLLDLSESTNDRAEDASSSLLDIEKKAALMLAGAAGRAGERLAVHGFSSNTRHEVNYSRLLEFGEIATASAHTRIDSLRARHSTRIGAALRHATAQLVRESNAHRSILLVTDGAPADIDVHDPDYLTEDARVAVAAARRLGVRAYCIAVDGNAQTYVRRIFGWRNYSIASEPRSLPTQLQRAFARLTAN